MNESTLPLYKSGNYSVHFEAGRSYGDISGESMFQDMGKLCIGGLLMFIFIQLVLPKKFNLVDMRVSP